MDPSYIAGTIRLNSYSDGFDPDYTAVFDAYPSIELETASFASNEGAVAKIQAGFNGKKIRLSREQGRGGMWGKGGAEMKQAHMLGSVRRGSTWFAVTVALSLLMMACGDAGGPAGNGDADLPVVRFQSFGPDFTGTIYVRLMQEEGIDEKHGFQAEFIEVDPDAASANLLTGEIDIALEQDFINMAIFQQEQDEHAVIFFPLSNMLTGMVVRDDSPYQTPEDLVGERVGHFGVESGTTSTIALALDVMHGIDAFEDYELVEAGPPALPELLRQGEIEAYMDYEPLALQGVLDIPGRYVFQPTPAWREQTGGWAPGLTYAGARVDWLRENAELALAVEDALEEARQAVLDTDYEIYYEDPYNEALQIDDPELLDAAIEYCRELPCINESWTEEDIQQINDYLALFVERELLVSEMPQEPVAVILEDFLAEEVG